MTGCGSNPAEGSHAGHAKDCSEVLGRVFFFLDNELAEGNFEVDGRPIAISDIRAPVFLVGTEKDHVAPWRSVYKFNLSADTEVTFALASGGHNVGIVNPPGRAKSSYRVRPWRSGDRLLTPEEWLAATTPIDGSWWTAWIDWLRERSSQRVAPPAIGARKAGLPPLEPAPGTYVHLR